MRIQNIRWEREEWIPISDAQGREAEVCIRWSWEIQPDLVPDVPFRFRLTVYCGRGLSNEGQVYRTLNSPFVDEIVGLSRGRTGFQN